MTVLLGYIDVATEYVLVDYNLEFKQYPTLLKELLL